MASELKQEVWSDQPSAVELFYRSWILGRDTFASQAQSGVKAYARGELLDIQPCPHPGDTYYRGDGFGPLCSSCGQLVYRSDAKPHHHAKPRRLPPWVVDLLAWAALVVLVKDLALRFLYSRRVEYTLYVVTWSSTFYVLQLTEPVSWLDWTSHVVQLILLTMIVLIPIRWAYILPHRPLLPERGRWAPQKSEPTSG